MAAAARTRKKVVKTTGAGHSLRKAWLLSAFVLAAVLLLPLTVPSSRREAPFLVDPAKVRLVQAPIWLEDATTDALCNALAALPAVSLRDDADLRDLVGELGISSGWIERVWKVRKHYPDRLEVQVDLRQPVARVRTPMGQEYVVDAEGVIVAPSEEAPGLIREARLPLLVRPMGPRTFVPGEVIEDPLVRQAVDVACEIQPHRKLFERRGLYVALVDASPMVRGDPSRISDLDLVTQDGLRIQWGRPASAPTLGALEPSVDTKVANLTQAALDWPGFEGIRTLRVQFSDHYSVEEMPGERPSARRDTLQAP